MTGLADPTLPARRCRAELRAVMPAPRIRGAVAGGLTLLATI
jgi:hypothetical protein